MRGCIGQTAAEESLAEAVIRMAPLAAFEDGRFKPLAAEELPEVRLEISILSPRRRAKNHAAIRPGDGVALESGGRRGVFLPQVWETLPDKTEFLETLCSQKAGLPKDCYKNPAAVLSVFKTESFSE